MEFCFEFIFYFLAYFNRKKNFYFGILIRLIMIDLALTKVIELILYLALFFKKNMKFNAKKKNQLNSHAVQSDSLSFSFNSRAPL